MPGYNVGVEMLYIFAKDDVIMWNIWKILLEMGACGCLQSVSHHTNLIDC